MKLHQALLLLLFVARAHAQCPQFPGFVFIENMDSHGYDIPALPGQPNPMTGDLEEVFEECEDNDEGCKAFNTWKYLKHTVVPLNDISHWPGTCNGVYIKCYDKWDDLVEDVEGDEVGKGDNPTPYFLCAGTHIATPNIELRNKNVTIGCSDPISGCIVDGSGMEESVFDIRGSHGNVALSDLTLQGGNSPTVHVVDGGILKVEGCKINAEEKGLFCHHSAVVVENSTFEGNKVSAIGVDVGCSMTISWSTFSENETPNDGGALVCAGLAAACTVKNSVLVGNKATMGKGGAIYCDRMATCDIDLTSCSFQNNVAANGANIHCGSSLACNL